MYFIYFLFSFIFLCNGERILVLYVHEETSHLLSMLPFLERLSQDGHELTIFNTGNDKNPIKINFKADIVHVYLPTLPTVTEFVSYVLWRHDPHSAMMAMIQKNGDDEMDRIMKYAGNKLKNLLNNFYDLIIVDEIFSVHGMTISKMFKKLNCVPYIIFTTSNIGPETNVADIAMGHTPALDATHGTFLPTDPNDSFKSGEFYYRMYNVLEAVLEISSFWYIVPKIYGYNSPSKLTSVKFDTSEVMKEAEMHLRESFDRIGRIVPHGNDFRSIGSHCKKTPLLEGDLKAFVEDQNSKGTIYLAFGSILNFDNCPEFVFDALFSALNEFPDYKIIMSMKSLKNRTLPKLNNNVKIIPWVPQYALLAHEKTKLFMSHGGLKSFKEALCTRTPILFLPVFAEQGLNARISIRLGIGSALNKYTLTKAQIVRELNKILLDESFQKNIDKFYDINLDRIMPSLDEGAWLIRKLFRRESKLSKRAANLPDSDQSLMFFRRKGMNMNSFEYFNFDIFVFIIFLIWLISK